MYVCMYVCVYVYMYVCMYICTYLFMYLFVYVCMCTYLHVHVSIVMIGMHTYLKAYIHTYIAEGIHTYLKAYIHTYVNEHIVACLSHVFDAAQLTNTCTTNLHTKRVYTHRCAQATVRGISHVHWVRAKIALLH